MGSIVVADVVIAPDLDPGEDIARANEIKAEILDICRDKLPQHKIPAMIRFVPSLEFGASGKLVRHA